MAARKKLDLLTAVEQIVEKAKGTGLSSDFYRKADQYIKYVAEKMELTAENGGYPPTQNGDIRSPFMLFTLMAMQY